MPLFSIVIPCFNAARTLSETLASVDAQSFDDYEVIIVDDGSTDQSAAIAEALARKNSRFQLVRLENGGPSRARNKAVFEHARGDYLAFLDADDLWSPEKLTRCAARLAGDDAPDGLYARIAFFRNDPSRPETVSTVLPHGLRVKDLLRENAVCTMSNIILRRDWFLKSGGFDEAITYGEDLEWLVRLAAVGARIEAIDETLVHYRASDGGLSADLTAMRQGWETAVATATRLGMRPSQAELSAAEAIHLRYLARRALRVRSPRGTALRIAIRAIRRCPAAYFSNPRRGVFTLAAAALELTLPTTLKRLALS